MVAPTLTTDKVDLLDDEFSLLKIFHGKLPFQKSANHLRLPSLPRFPCLRSGISKPIKASLAAEREERVSSAIWATERPLLTYFSSRKVFDFHEAVCWK